MASRITVPTQLFVQQSNNKGNAQTTLLALCEENPLVTGNFDYMAYMDTDVLCLKKADKLTHSLMF